jgi:hypothetical protein
MTTTDIVLPCPICHTPDALTCQVVRTGEGLWVSRRDQVCACDVYLAWDVVWWAVRRHLRQTGDGRRESTNAPTGRVIR